MNLYHDSRSIAYRRPQGAAESGSTVELRVRAEGVNWVELRLWQQNAEVIHRMEADRAEFVFGFDRAARNAGTGLVLFSRFG